MDADVNPSVVGIVLILMAAVSLFAMISLNQINYIVHGDLYSFGLQFSYRWAIPYWLFSGIVFGLCWVNIAIAIIFTLHIFKKSRTQTSASERSQAGETEEETTWSEEEKEQRKISEYVKSQKEELTRPIGETVETSSEEIVEEVIKQPEEALETVKAQEMYSQQTTEGESGSIGETEKTQVSTEDAEKRRSIP
jgi:uncharacterized membrane protein